MLSDLDLEATPYYHYRNRLDERFYLADDTFRAILRWADMLKCRLKVGAPYVLWFHFSDTASTTLLPLWRNDDSDVERHRVRPPLHILPPFNSTLTETMMAWGYFAVRYVFYYYPFIKSN